ncbi:MAG: Archaeal PaREP1/PaREP8 family protein [Candidatus Bathyarchaeota archaeon BA2]|nr:MAG: Archaeal PaREP1/PaREP8 family protein [Candidatus Bathyarchaeota archaeon BA2]
MTQGRPSTRKVEVKFLDEARKFLDAAIMEFEKGVKEGKDETIRDAAEKAWNSTIQATTALLLAKGFDEEDVKTYRQKRLTLEELSIKDEEVRRLGLGDRFMAREYRLHVRCFYDGEYTIDALREELKKAKQYIDDVAKLLS